MAEQGDQSGFGSFINPYGFNGNKTVILKHYFGQTLRISPDNEDEIDLKGDDDDEYATWNIEIDGEIDGMYIVKFKSIKSGKYLTICGEGEAINVTGDGGEMSKFKVYKQDNDNSYKFESVNFESKYAAVQSNGDDDQKVAIQNEADKFAQFTLWTNEEDGAYASPKDDNDNKEDVDEAAIEEQQKKEEEEEKKQAEEEEEARKKAEEEEEERKRKEEEEKAVAAAAEEEERKRKEEEEEAARIKAEQEEAERKQKEEEEARQKAEEEEAERLKAEEEERKKKEEEMRKKEEEEERRKIEEEERKKKEEEERKKKEEEERRKKEEEEMRKKEEEEERKKKEEEEQRKREEEEEAAAAAAVAEAERLKKEEEEKKRKEEEAAAAAAEEERKRKEEEERKKKEEEAAAAEEEERKRKEEEEAVAAAAEEEKKRKEEEEEKKRKDEEAAAAAAEEERKRKEEEAAAAEEEERKRKEEEEAKVAAAKKEEEEEEEEECNVNIEIGMKFEMGGLYYTVQNVDKTVMCIQSEDINNNDFPSEIVLQRKQMEHVVILSEDDYNIKVNEYKASKDNKEEQKEKQKEEEIVNINIEIGMKFEMGSLYYLVKSVDEFVQCQQIEDTMNDEFPSEIVLQKNQMEHVLILTEDEYNVKKNEYNNKKKEKKEDVIEIGIKFQMGTVYYFVVSVDEYVKCQQVDDIKNNEFPMEIILEKNQMDHVKILSDDDYKTALNEYNNNKSLEEKEEKEDKTENVFLCGLESFKLEYIFDDDPETVIIRHQHGQTLMVESGDETKLNFKGDTGEYAQWIVEFDGGDKYQRITLKNKKTDKYLRIINDGKDIDVGGNNKDDDNIYFKAITNDNDKQKHCIKLESCSFNGKYIAIEPEQGIIIGDTDNKNRDLSFWKQLNIEKGVQFKMGDICYEVESIGDHIKCKQCGDNKEFPDIVYLERNQLYHVEIIKSEEKKKTDKTNKERPLSAKAKIAMFEKKEDAPKKETKPAPKKLKKNKINAKFAGLNINPNALKPGGGGRTKITNVNKEGGNLDQKPKVEQATITKGKRKRRKKRKTINDDVDESKDDHIVATQLFYDEKAAAKAKKEKEKQKKAAAKAGKAGKKNDNNKENTKGGDTGNSGGGGAGDNAQQQQAGGGGGGCCVIL